ncbi:MAG TPA: Gmad2 immunoglobulin-like domain-containing protein [Candidatus Paceibacterota bacterium]
MNKKIILGALLFLIAVIVLITWPTVSTEKENLIQLTSPKPNEIITSPLLVQGKARGYWFFEASFPVKLLDENSQQITIGIAQAQGEWMTEDFVPFKTILTFVKPTTKKGWLVLEKDNPSGLPEHNDELKIPVVFE